MGFPTRSDSNQSVQTQMARGLKFIEGLYYLLARGLKFIEGLYYLYSKNKGADQMGDYRAANLRLCFGIYKKQVFSCAHISHASSKEGM